MNPRNPKNELERLAASKTNEMITQILQGKPVESTPEAVAADRSEQDILKSVESAYREVMTKKPE